MEEYIVNTKITLKEAYNKINENDDQLVFVVDDKEKVLFAISDGDIRRYILNGGTLEDNVMSLNKDSLITAESINKANQLCKQYKVVPVVDDKGRIKILVKKNFIFS